MYMNRIGEVLALTPPPATGAAGQPQQPFWYSLLPMVLIVVVFYFILLRPQQQRAKQQRKMLETIKPGDKVVTSSGIVGVVITVKERTITLRSSDAKFEVTKASVTEVLDASTTTES
jgi:preprotein translocase subunit YajC